MTGRYHGTAEWKRLRLCALERDGFKCVLCGRPAKVADHVVSRLDGGADTLANLRSLCTRCDNAIKEDHTGKRRSRGVISGCDAQGNPLDPRHPWRNWSA